MIVPEKPEASYHLLISILMGIHIIYMLLYSLLIIIDNITNLLSHTDKSRKYLECATFNYLWKFILQKFEKIYVLFIMILLKFYASPVDSDLLLTFVNPLLILWLFSFCTFAHLWSTPSYAYKLFSWDTKALLQRKLK